MSSLGGCGPSLQLGDDVIKPSSYVRLLGVIIVILVLTGMFHMSARRVSSGSGSWDVFITRWTLSL